MIYSSQNVFQYISTVKMLEIDARRCSIKKLSWKIWENSQGNTCEVKTLLADLACNFSKKCLQHRCFPMILQNFPGQPFCKTLANGIKASARYHFAIKWSFFVITKKLVIIISTVNVTKPPTSCWFGHFLKKPLMENFNGKFSCFYLKHVMNALTLSWRRPLSYRNQSIDLLCKSVDSFLYDNGPRHEKVNPFQSTVAVHIGTTQLIYKAMKWLVSNWNATI